MQAHPSPSPAPSSTAAEPGSKPFLKWSGGKQRLLPQLLPLLPPGRRLIEPFVGAGSVFLATNYQHYLINDANSDLAAMWVAVKLRPREFAEHAASFFTEGNRTQEAYLRIRAEFNRSADRFERAVRLPYLNKFGFNGLFRVNSSGAFNTPYGQPAKLPTFPWDQIDAAARRLDRCLVLSGGFAAAMELAGLGDVVYCDPPYLDSGKGSSFTGYTAEGFGLKEHEELLECAIKAVSRGANVLISNHDTPQVRDLYRGWHIEALEVSRSIASKADRRGKAKEIVAWLPFAADRNQLRA